ncbi:MAG: hypothetical protein APF76_07860 [Desulfitibacter sp. BRH_c19]|nr:MAG: hypothetical protein APF76_07860 [Desulfitibacter sp. BRH_c19]
MDWSKILTDAVTLHRGKLIGATIGLVFGLCTIFFGFWKALFLGVCIYVGYFVGRRMDKNEDFKELLRKFWGNS